MGLKKQCRCGTRIDINQQCCDKCRPSHEASKAKSNSIYDNRNRNKVARAFYKSTEWLKIREVIFNRYSSIDIYLYYTKGIIEVANTVHHIVEISEDSNRRLDDKNLIPVTQKTHEKIHRMYQSNKNATQDMLFSLIKRWDDEMAR